MLLAGVFLAAFARSLASPAPVVIPSSPIPSPLCVVTAALSASAGTCDPNKKRTIFDILYSCLGVIFLCTYISIHHNIPDQNDSWGKKTWLKIRTMVYAMLAPEIVIMWALRQRIMAGVIAEWGKAQGWTKTHGFFVQMGGLMLEGEGKKDYQVVLWWKSPVAGLYVENRLEKLPTIRKKEIQDRGKGDLLAKTIVVLQTSWFVVQCIARRVEGLLLTELELVTLAFAALNMMTYILWWDKPLNVEYPIYFDKDGNRVDGPEEKEEEAWYRTLWRMVTQGGGGGRGEDRVGLLGGSQKVAETDGPAERTWRRAIKKPFGLVFGPLLDMTNVERVAELATSVHPFYAAALDLRQHRLAYLFASVIGVAFGGIHLVGWNFRFLTNIELWLWRGSSLVLTVTPAIITLSWPLSIDWYNITSSDPLIHRFLWFLVARIGTPVYIAARLVIIFLAFFAFRDLPESVYENVKWSNFIPHI
ncbi:hypothetical protein AX16_001839 [Volvariella volvacea WC 439]|nr:hypothetical protein AX16_001839 [Volvariella volvacea WC 439]